MLSIKQFVFNPFGENTYIVFDTETRHAIVIDPGMITPDEYSLFDGFIADNHLTLDLIVNTHLHLDHCFGDNWVRDKYQVQIAAHKADEPLGASLGEQMRQFGIFAPENLAVTVDRGLNDGDMLEVGAYRFTVIHLPGHSPGGIALYCAEEQTAFVGDSIFFGSIGRTDLPGGDYRMLIDSLRSKIFALPDNTRLLTGHDRYTTVATEKLHNPYLV